jgi:hypothetical protein
MMSILNLCPIIHLVRGLSSHGHDDNPRGGTSTSSKGLVGTSKWRWPYPKARWLGQPDWGLYGFHGEKSSINQTHQRKTWFSSGLNRGKARHVRHGDKQSAVRLTCESLNHMLQDLGIDPSQGNLWSGRPVDYQLHFINVSMRELTIWYQHISA